jgi:hypothetical protein
MIEAASKRKVSHLNLSLQGTRHHFGNFIPKLSNASEKVLLQIYKTLLNILIHKELPQRPGRCEPRVRKRRPKAYPLMKKSRQQYHVDLKSA